MSVTHLFSPLTMRSVTARNRIWISPMVQSSALGEDGVATDWHLVHLGSRAVGGAGLIIVGATAVEARGRIGARDLGLWNDAQADALAPIARFMSEQGCVPAIQLAHAGRKAGVAGPVAPSPLAASPDARVPDEASSDDIQGFADAFEQAALRAYDAGFGAVEIHAAHGFLLHEFLSPLANRRRDEYGGDFAGRCRLTLEVTRAVRRSWPDKLPLFVRISATDWVEGGWDLEQSIELARLLASEGVDLVDCSSGGLAPQQQIEARPGYQVPFAESIRREAGVMTAAVGLLTEAAQADGVVRQGQADAVLIGRESLRDPYWPLRAARELGYKVEVPWQYERGW